jgi:hypothetical protein
MRRLRHLQSACRKQPTRRFVLAKLERQSKPSPSKRLSNTPARGPSGGNRSHFKNIPGWRW